MNENLMTVLNAVEVGERVELEALSLFPLSWKGQGQVLADMAVLEEGIKCEKVIVEEITEGGSVPNLQVTNDLDVDLFILEGEEVQGAKQNRILNICVVIAAKTKVTVPVSCVEHGRWSYRSKHFSSGNRASFRIRRDASKSVNESLKCEREFRSDQCKVWDNVEEELQARACSSPTSALSDAYETMSVDLDGLIEKVNLPENTAGVIVAFGNRVVSVELFGTPGLFRKLSRKVMRSYAFDIYGKREVKNRPSKDTAEKFLKGIVEASVDWHKSPGVGTQIRFESDYVVGSALVTDGGVAYASLMTQANGV